MIGKSESSINPTFKNPNNFDSLGMKMMMMNNYQNTLLAGHRSHIYSKVCHTRKQYKKSQDHVKVKGL